MLVDIENYPVSGATDKDSKVAHHQIAFCDGQIGQLSRHLTLGTPGELT